MNAKLQIFINYCKVFLYTKILRRKKITKEEFTLVKLVRLAKRLRKLLPHVSIVVEFSSKDKSFGLLVFDENKCMALFSIKSCDQENIEHLLNKLEHFFNKTNNFLINQNE